MFIRYTKPSDRNHRRGSKPNTTNPIRSGGGASGIDGRGWGGGKGSFDHPERFLARLAQGAGPGFVSRRGELARGVEVRGGD